MTTSISETTELEAVACTILAQHQPWHPFVREYVVAVTSDPNFDTASWNYEPGPEIAGQTRMRGYLDASPSDLHKALVDLCAHGPRPEPYSGEGEPEDDSPYSWDRARRLDVADFHLAQAITRYRREGRTNETGHSLRGLGGPVAIVHTSLAAAIAEYVQAIRNAYDNAHASSVLAGESA